MESNIKTDLSTFPAKAKCEKCKAEVEIPPSKKISDTMAFIKQLEEEHKDCI